MSHHLFNTELNDRTLWYDGTSSYHSANIIQLLKQGYKVNWVDKITTDIASYNNLALPEQQIKVKQSCDPLDFSWNLPTPYDKLDPLEYIMDMHSTIVADMDVTEIAERERRLATELVKFREMNLLHVLRTIIYVINTLTSSGTIWGIGRGSSVSSYVLYVIGVHDVDSFAYDLDIDDFLHD